MTTPKPVFPLVPPTATTPHVYPVPEDAPCPSCATRAVHLVSFERAVVFWRCACCGWTARVSAH